LRADFVAPPGTVVPPGWAAAYADAVSPL